MKNTLLILLITAAIILPNKAISQELSPELVTPEDNSKNLSIFPVLIWEKADDFENYYVQCADNKNFTNPMELEIESLTWDMWKPLKEGTTYFWRVKATETPDIPENWSEVREFTTGVYELDNVKDKTGNTWEIPPDVTIKWEPVEGADYYEVRISDNLFFDDLVLDSSGIKNTVMKYTLKYNKKYYYSIRAVSSDGYSTWSRKKYLKTEKLFQYSPRLSKPDNGAIKQSTNGKLEWLELKGAEKYLIELWSDNYEQPIISGFTEETEIEYSLLYGTVYHWHVKAYAEDDTSYWSETWSFRTEFETLPELPKKVELLEPLDGKLYTVDTGGMPFLINLKWEESQPFVDYYQVQVSSDSLYKDFYLDRETTETYTEFDQYQMEEGIYYFWRVRAFNENGPGPWSDSWKMKINFVSVNDDNYSQILKVMPNPATEKINIRNLSDEAIERIELIDINGNNVLMHTPENIYRKSININLKGIASGNYFLLIYQNEKIYSQKLLITY